MSSHAVTSAERQRWERDGFLVRESVLRPREIGARIEQRERRDQRHTENGVPCQPARST